MRADQGDAALDLVAPNGLEGGQELIVQLIHLRHHPHGDVVGDLLAQRGPVGDASIRLHVTDFVVRSREVGRQVTHET